MPEAVLAGLLVVCCLIATVLNHAGTVSLTLWTILLAVMAVPNLIAAMLAATDLMPVREKTAEATPEPVTASLVAPSRPARWSPTRRGLTAASSAASWCKG